MGEGILKDSVPEAHTDYIIAVITEEFGSIISIFVIIIFLYISYKIIKKCVKIYDDNSKISLCGLSSLLIFQTFIHIGKHEFITTTGMTLPFLSYGGSSLIGSSILAGVILNYTKNSIKMINNDKKIIIASGGTGGHIFPAVGLANYLNKLGFNSTLTTDKEV